MKLNIKKNENNNCWILLDDFFAWALFQYCFFPFYFGFFLYFVLLLMKQYDKNLFPLFFGIHFDYEWNNPLPLTIILMMMIIIIIIIIIFIKGSNIYFRFSVTFWFHVFTFQLIFHIIVSFGSPKRHFHRITTKHCLVHWHYWAYEDDIPEYPASAMALWI